MLTTKCNSCPHVYLSQCLSVSLHLYIHFLKVNVRNREIKSVRNWKRHVHKLNIPVLYIQYWMSSEKVSV